MNAPDKFLFKAATREQTPLLLGLVGPSGSGKTFSALRLATGIQSVIGGDIAVIDTEARRALHYAGKFDFKHLDFAPPHGPDRYLEAIQAAVAIGAKTIVVDSMSHEHEGAGGVLEWHEAELDRIAGDDWKKREAVNLLGWAKPKGARRKLINGLLQLHANFIFCFRAKEKVKPMKNAAGKTEIVPQGWQAIAGEEFVYEMTDRFLLLPGSQGVPAFDKESMETGVPKLPGDHTDIVSNGAQLNEDIGALLAQWALGGPAPLAEDVLQAFAGIGITPAQIALHLGRQPSAADTKALKLWYRDLKAGKVQAPVVSADRTVDRSTAQVDPADAAAIPAADSTRQPHQAPAGDAGDGAPVVSYARLAERLQKAADRDAALLILDESRALPGQQQSELQLVFDSRWPAGE